MFQRFLSIGVVNYSVGQASLPVRSILIDKFTFKRGFDNNSKPMLRYALIEDLKAGRDFTQNQMAEEQKTEFNQLYAGFVFPRQSYTFNALMVSAYLDAVKESNDLYLKDGLVPPMEVTAYAMAALSKSISLPPGTIHVTQELDFLDLVRVGDTVTCCSKVSRKVDRSGMHIMSTDIEVINQNQVKVLTGKVGFILPEPEGSVK